VSEKLSKSEILRQWINDKLDNEYDYSSVNNRTADFNEFINSHDDFNEKQHKPLYHYVLKKELEKKGYNLQNLGLSPTKRQESDMIAIIKPEPQSPLMPMVEPNDSDSEDTIHKPKIMTPDMHEPIEISVKTVGFVCKFAFDLAKLRYKMMDNLTDEEQEMLGQIWKPVFQRYLANDQAMLVIALFCTLAMLSKKTVESKRKEKELQGKKELESEETKNSFLH
jgi:hypothetical protein